MAVFTFQWCRVEGNPIPDLGKEYGTFTQLPSNTKVFYGTPEIQINNPTSVVNGCVYKVVPISEFGYNNILDIDDNYSDVLQKANTYDKEIKFDDENNSAQYYHKPFVIKESSIIFHADSTKKYFDRYAIVYVDEGAVPEMITIGATYKGLPIPVGDTFELKDIEVFAIYADSNRVQITEGYTIEPADRVITKLQSNPVKITYTTPEGTTFVTSIIIEGVKSLQSIEGFYDGPSVAYDTEALRKYFIVVAKYSDGSSTTVSDFSFPNGNVVNAINSGVITLYHNGFYTTVVVPTYEVASSRLMAYYNGPNIEVGQNFDTRYCKIKIYYQSKNNTNAYYEDVSPDDCTFSTETVDHEGTNHVLIQYTGKAGTVSTTMIIIGINPEALLSFIEVQYTGPSVVKGKSFSLERVICKAHYTNGSVVVVRNFAVNSNVIQYVGPNEFVATYKEKDTIVTATFTVNGLESDNTTQNNYHAIALQNHYPEATRMNHRYRGPAESYKTNSVHYMIEENIKELYDAYMSIEKDVNALIESINGSNNIKTKTLNTIFQLESETTSWIADERFTTGKYQLDKEANHE